MQRLREAQRAGLEIGLPLCANSVWLDQFADHPELRAQMGARVRKLARRGLERTTVRDVQSAAWDAYRYLMEKDTLGRKRATLMHELLHVYGVDADQTVGLTNIYLGDWPSWWNQQHDRYHTLIRATTVAEQHRLIERLWP